MSNIFKANSRFSALLDDKNDSKKDKGKDKESKNKEKESKNKDKESKNKEKESKNKDNDKQDTFNSFKSSEKKDPPFSSYHENESERQRYKLERTREQKDFKKKQEQEKLEQEKLEQEKLEQEKQELLNINNFPELISVAKKEVNNNVSYVNILKKEQEIKESCIDPDLVNLDPGCLLIKKDRETGNIIMKYGIGTVLYEEPTKSEEEIRLDIYNSLVELHEKRTEEYIELNGYDIWEKMFKYPDWEEREAYLYEIDDSSDEDDNDSENHDDYDDYDYDDYDDY